MGQPKNRTQSSTKILWLIPYTLAKKLLTSKTKIVSRDSSAEVCGTKALTKRAVCVKFFWGEDPLFQNAPRQYNKRNYLRFEKFSP